MKLKSLDKQLEERAKRWFLSRQTIEARKDAKELWENAKDRKEIIQRYLITHPNTKKDYEMKKKIWKKVKIGVALTGSIVAVTLGGVYKQAKAVEQRKEIEQELENENAEPIEVEQDLEETKDSYQEFFEEARSIENTRKRDEFITIQTKQFIVDVYNRENPEKEITVEQLKIYDLEENVLKKKDRLGNYTYERVKQNVQYEKTDTQELVKDGAIYDFRIDGKTVAVFDKNSKPLYDKNVSVQDMSFQKMIELFKQSQKLKEIYKYNNNDATKENAENEYKRIAQKLLEEKEEIEQDKQINEI